MLALYLLSLGFGGTLILVSLLLGAGDKDLSDHDTHTSLDHDHDGDGAPDHDPSAHADGDAHADAHADGHGSDKEAPGSSFGLGWWLLSMRFWTFSIATFGLTGTLLTLLSVPAAMTGTLAVGVGLLLGIGAARLFRALNSDEVSGVTDLARFVGEEARVVIPIKEGQPGKIAIQTLAGRIEMMATTKDREPLGMGAAVLIAGVSRGVADVSKMPVIPGAGTSKQKAQATSRVAEGP